MMTLKEFTNAITKLQAFNEYEDKLAEVGVNIWEREEVSRLTESYVRLIEIGLELPVDHCLIGYANDFEYWYYELFMGKYVAEYFSPEDKEYEGLGTDLKKVYDFLIEEYHS